MNGIKATSSIQISLSIANDFLFIMSIIAITGNIMATIFVSSQRSKMIDSIMKINYVFFVLFQVRNTILSLQKGRTRQPVPKLAYWNW